MLCVIEGQSHQKWVMKKKRLGTPDVLGEESESGVGVVYTLSAVNSVKYSKCIKMNLNIFHTNIIPFCRGNCFANQCSVVTACQNTIYCRFILDN